MAVFCPVAPTRILRPMCAEDPQTVRHNLFLAHDVIADETEYDLLFGRGFRHFSFMDNSLVELKQSVDVNMVKEAVRITKSRVFVLPDAYGKGEETVDAILSNYDEWKRKIPDALPMAVVQGENLHEWLKCLEAITNSATFPWIAIPRVTLAWSGSRRPLIEYVRMYAPRARIHLLGFSDDMCDDFLSASHPHVSSIDSAVPVRMGSVGQTFSLLADPGPRGDWWPTATYTPTCAANTRKADSMLFSVDQHRSADITV